MGVKKKNDLLEKKICQIWKNYINFAEIIFDIVMFAIVNIAGQQFKVRKDDELFVHRLEGNVGDKVAFSQVLMTGDDSTMSFGGKSVDAEIIDHLKGDKVIVFKKRRRKGYQKMNGHRQYLTKIKINGIA